MELLEDFKQKGLHNIIHSFFKDNPNIFVSHHIDSYNEFMENGIKQIFKEKNPIQSLQEQDNQNNYRFKYNIYLGGKNGDLIYYGKPIIYDDDNAHFMYPNEARLRNMTYGLTIHYDVEVDFFDSDNYPIIRNNGNPE